MLTFDSVKLRLDREQPMTFLEFNYMILQAYDFLELSRLAGCRLQLGGSDQWGNIVNGIELARRIDGTEVYGVTTPLITTADGAKMGKTAQGAVWLSPEMLSPYDYWQFWRNTADADVGRFLRLFTDLPLDEIARLESLAGAEINEAKIVLATEATAMLHGRAAAEAAAATARETFEAGGAGEDLPTLATEGSVSLLAALTGLGFCASNGEAKRKIAEGAVRIDDQVGQRPGTDDRGRRRSGEAQPRQEEARAAGPLALDDLGEAIEVLADRAPDEPAHDLRPRARVAHRNARGRAIGLDPIGDATAFHRPFDKAHVQDVVGLVARDLGGPREFAAHETAVARRARAHFRRASRWRVDRFRAANPLRVALGIEHHRGDLAGPRGDGAGCCDVHDGPTL